jgi:tight adherence protein C
VNPALAGLTAMALYGLALVGLRLARTAPPSLRGVQQGTAAVQRPSPAATLRGRVGRRFGPHVLRAMGPPARRRLEHRLDIAGRPDRLSIAGFAETRAADVATCTVIGLGATTISPLLLPALVVYGWYRFELQLRARGRTRQQQIERDLPDFLDILSVTVQAGMKFRAALRRVAEQLDSPVSDEFRIALQQMDVGASRRAAFEGVRDRNDSPSLNRFIGALLQAEELGAPLSDAMARISRDMRTAFGQRVRKQAAEAAPKVSLVATILLMPGAALLLIGGLIIGSDLDLGGIVGG